MTISLPDARQLSDEVLEALRLRAVRGCQLGYTETELAELLGLSRETVSRWWTAYADGGPDALPGGAPAGPSAPGGPSRTSRLATSKNRSITGAPRSRASAPPRGPARRCAT